MSDSHQVVGNWEAWDNVHDNDKTKRKLAQLRRKINIYIIHGYREIDETINDSNVVIRKRLFATFERGMKQRDLEEGNDHERPDHDQAAIRKGNRVAHCGHVYLDALLFDLPNPPSASTYQELYGVAPDFILRNYYSTPKAAVFHVLNMYATKLADTDRVAPVPKNVRISMNRFVAAIQEEPGKDLEASPRLTHESERFRAALREWNERQR